jgi:hypothetical protein
MLRLILAAVTVLIVAASVTSRLSDVRAAGNKTSASNKVVQPSVRSAPQQSGTSRKIRQGWPSKVHW